MSRKTVLLIALAFFLPAMLFARSDGSKATEDGSPGGTGTCGDCHGTLQLNNTAISLSGLPASYTPGATYSLTLTLTAGQQNSGFTIISKSNTSTKAKGTFVVTDAVNTALNTGHIVQTASGAALLGSPMSFNFNWTAPPAGSGLIIFYSSAVAGDNGGNTGGDLSYTNRWRLNEASSDSVKPSRTAPLAPTAGRITNDNTPYLLWRQSTDASGIKRYYVSVNGITNGSATTNLNWPVSLADNTYTWFTYAVDNAATPNTGTNSKTNTFIVDTIRPSTPVRISLVSNAVTNDNTPFFSWNTAADANGIRAYLLQIDSKVSNVGLLTSLSWPNALAEGLHGWRVRSIDNAGNTNTAGSFWTNRIDTVAPFPTTVLLPLAGSSITNQTPTMVWNRAIDTTTSIKQYRVVPVLGTTNVVASPTTNWTPGSLQIEGSYTWQVQAVDLAGNRSTFASRTFTIDRTGPIAPALISPADLILTRSASPNLLWNKTTDALSLVASYRIAAPFGTTNIVATPNTNLSTEIFIEGTNRWQVQGVDTAQNRGPWSAFRRVILDTTPPSPGTRITLFSNEVTNDNTPFFSWNNATDLNGISSYLLQIDAKVTNVGLITSLNWPTPLSDSTLHSWKLRAIDSAGNTNAWSSTWGFTTDAAAPGTPILSSPADLAVTTNRRPLFVWNKVADTTSGVKSYRIALPGSTNTVLAPATNYSPLADLAEGTNRWQVQAIDNAGNPGAWSVSRRLLLDRTAPPAPIASAPADLILTRGTSPILTWTKSVDTLSGTLTYRIAAPAGTTNSVAAASTNTSTEILVEGTNRWQVQAVDAAGNASAWSAFRRIIVDTTPPTSGIRITLFSNEVTNDSTPFFSWNIATDLNNISAYILQVDAKVTNVGLITSLNWPTALADSAAHSWKLRAVDGAGNTNGWSSSWGFTTDTVPPNTVSLSAPSSNSSVSTTDPALSWNTGSDATTSVAFYLVQIDDTAAFSSPLIRKTNSPAWTVIGLAAGSTNWWKVRAVDAAGNTNGWSPTWRFTIDTSQVIPTLVSPANLSYTNGNAPTFVWSDESVNGAGRYAIQLRTNAALTSRIVASNTNIATYSVNLGAIPGHVYFWRVRAFKTGFTWQTWSGVGSFTVDTNKPSVPSLVRPSDLFLTNYARPGLLWNKSTDNAGVAGYRLALAGATNLLSGSTTTNFLPGSDLSDGTNRWFVSSYDLARNRSAWSAVRRVIIDTTPPSAPALVSPASNFLTRNLSQTVSWSVAADANGILRYEARVDSGAVSNAGAALSDTLLFPAGTHTWSVRAVDNAGNIGPWSSAWTLTLDTTPPSVVALSSPSSNTFQASAPAVLSWNTASDANGIAGYIVQIDDVKNFSSPVSKTTNGTLWSVTLSAGTNWWRVKAFDNAGNTNAIWSTVWTVVLDTAQVIPALIAPANGTLTNQANPLFRWSNESATASWYQLEIRTNNLLGRVVLSNNALPAATPSYSFIPSLASGTYSWRVRALKSSTGLWNTWSSSNRIIIDTIGPAAPIQISPASNSWTSAPTPKVSWNTTSDINGILRYEVVIDGSAVSNTGTKTTNSLPFLSEGNHIWAVRAVDNAKNTGTQSPAWIIRIDTLSPSSPSGLSPSSGLKTNNSSIGLSWTASSDGTGSGVAFYQMMIDTQLSTNVSTTKAPAVFGEGLHGWKVRAFDSAGNAGPWSSSNTFRVDTTAPTSPSAVSPGTYVVTGTSVFTWSAALDSGAGVSSYRLEVSSLPTFSAPESVLTLSSTSTNILGLAEGIWYWRVRASDSAGNTGAYAATNSFTISLSAPTGPSGLAPATGSFASSATPSLSWSPVSAGAGVNEYVLEIDGIGYTNISTNFTAPTLAEGTHAWRVLAVDNADRLGAFSVSNTLIVDLTPPAAITGARSPTNNALSTLSTFGLSWQASSDVNGIAGYQVRIRTNSNATPGIVFTSSTSLNVTLPSVSTNLWSVAAVDSAGNIGPWTAWTVVRVRDVATVPVSLDNVSPGTVFNDMDSTIILTGTGFAVGVKVYLGTTELSAVLTGTTKISAVMPEGFPAGVYDVRVENPDTGTDTRISGLKVKERIHKTAEVIHNRFDPDAGESAVISLNIEGPALEVTVTVFDLLGQEVAVIKAGTRSGASSVEWDGTNNEGKTVASGLYPILIKAGKEVIRDQIFVLKK